MNGRLPRSLFQAEGGPFGLGFLVELGPVRDVGAPPELEDREFSEERVAVLHQLPPEQFWGNLESMVSPDLAAGFGLALERRDSGFAVPLGQGAASLACLVPDGDVALKVNDYGKIRCQFEVEDGPVDLSVTDIRLCERDHKTIRRSLVRRLDRQMANGTHTILALGLARPFQAGGDTRLRHWLQVNNIFQVDDPYME